MNENKFKILLVDDEIDILEFISYNLEKEGYIVYTAQNGIDAIKQAEKHQPHLIILDVMMPEMDGIAACEEIRKIPSLSNTMIIPRLQVLKPAPTITSPSRLGPKF